MLFIHHPEVSGDHPPVQVGEKAFAKVWEPRGWVQVNDDGSPYEPPPAPEKLTGQALEDALAAAGISGSGLSADEKRAALAAHTESLGV